jgi:hypothetical protein
MYLYLLYNKNEALDAFKIFKVEIENNVGNIKIMRWDKCEEYYERYIKDRQTLGPFTKFLQENVIAVQYTIPSSPDQMV